MQPIQVRRLADQPAILNRQTRSYVTPIHFQDFKTMLKLSDYLILAAAFISFLISIGLWFTGQKDEGLFVGIWVPSILSFGNYINSRLKMS